ncbi:MAG: MOSC domain-containing protein [Myxococcota bacterium]
MQVESLFVYPVKGCAGVELERMQLDEHGPLLDRLWMVVDGDGRFMTQRACPRLALIHVEVGADHLELSAEGRGSVRVPLAEEAGDGARRRVVCWWFEGDGIDQGAELARWLSEGLGQEAALVRMAADTVREVNPARSPERAVTRFTDGYPFLVINRSSLDDLDRRMREPVPVNRYRPNVVVSGAPAYAEDRWRRIRIADIPLDVVKSCQRCAVTVTDQATAARVKEPLATLARYRRVENGDVLLGVNAVHRASGSIAVGDPIEVVEEGEPPVFL